MIKITTILLTIFLIAGCVSNGNKSMPQKGSDGFLFAAKKGVFLSEKASNELTEQAYMLVNSATKVNPLIENLDSYEKAFNTTLLISNFLFTEKEKLEFRDNLTQEIGNSPRLSIGFPDDSDIAIYSLCSYKLAGDKAILEVIIGASDWDVAQASGLTGAEAFFKATVWYAVSRKVIAIEEILDKGEISTSKLLPYMVNLAKNPTKQLMASY